MDDRETLIFAAEGLLSDAELALGRGDLERALRLAQDAADKIETQLMRDRDSARPAKVRS